MRFKKIYLPILTLFVLAILFFVFRNSKLIPSEPFNSRNIKSSITDFINNSINNKSSFRSQDNFSKQVNSFKCILPENIKKSIGVVSIVPGIKEDATTSDDYWSLLGNQPVILGYFSDNGNDYFVGGLKDSVTGNCFKMTFLLRGDIDIVDHSDRFNVDKIRVDNSLISFSEFKQKFPLGSQARVFVLGRRPDKIYLVDSFCAYKPPLSEYYCTLQRATQMFSTFVVDDTFIEGLSKFPADKESLYVASVSENVK